MFNLKWMFWLTIAVIGMGGPNNAGCSGCGIACPHLAMEYQKADAEWQAAVKKYETAVSNGADQSLLDFLNAERMEAAKKASEALSNHDLNGCH